MKNIKDFASFIYENEVNETLHEASHAGRAWAGKIKNIDNLLSWMYDKDLLTRSEKKEKDRKFIEYYRYYNDGDFPAGLKSRGIRPSMKEEYIEKALEEYIEEFIKKILAKYAGKYDRKDFRIDTILSDLYTLKSVIERNDAYGVLNYWSKKVKVNDSEFEKLLVDLEKIHSKVKNDINKVISSSDFYANKKSYEIPRDNYTVVYQKERLEEDGLWNSDLQKEYDKMVEVMKKMSDIIENVIEAARMLKSEIGV